MEIDKLRQTKSLKMLVDKYGRQFIEDKLLPFIDNNYIDAVALKKIEELYMNYVSDKRDEKLS